ncbi:uncharacterized protein LOC115627021 [Scaptodrosophila lebanonensis]|uniref:Uncharacterized protein LOC115627021 n=1 Tax=Drosophila lebanonensis TaxID=7225 RepID=A0A6J2TP41_DROLE|nr:uncharacterized protein LOC115627021 [Scaptodrosophila lebanonensis]
MYKTIRHGENSLQYTILPQNDDFRIEGKLTNASRGARAGVGASGGIAHKRNGAPRRRRTFFAYLGLIFVCTVIIGAVLIPFLVSVECLPSPSEWFLKTKAALTRNGGAAHTVGSAAALTAATAPPAGIEASIGKTVQIVNRNGVEQFVLKLNKTATAPLAVATTSATTTTSTTTTAAPIMTTTKTAIYLQDQQQMRKMQPTILPLPIYLASTALPPTKPPQPVAPAAPPLNSLNRLPPTSTITTRIIQVPLLKSAAKKPIMPPVLAKTQSTQMQPNSASVPAQPPETVVAAQNKSNDWINTHWPYIDPSTYIQWTGYKAEDSVLLPALLGFALIGMILIITVCLVARNKRTIVSSVRKRNRNDIEEQGAEDNATLLTTTNLSDDD